MFTGKASIPLSDLQGRLIFYKYALVNTYSQERECDLEEISLEDRNIPETFKSRKAQIYRVLNIPQTELKANSECWICPKPWPVWWRCYGLAGVVVVMPWVAWHWLWLIVGGFQPQVYKLLMQTSLPFPLIIQLMAGNQVTVLKFCLENVQHPLGARETGR